jgi:hypothetical protein
MNSLSSNRVLNQLLTLVSIAGAILITATGIELLYQALQFIETSIGAATREAGQYISYRY